MDIVFEANFATTGSPSIKIYKIEEGVYTLVKTDTMVATPETGKYSYKYAEGDAVSDYSARMALGEETVNGVYNSLFYTILSKCGGGGGGGIVYSSMTKAQVKKIVEMAETMFKETLNDIYVSVPNDLGVAEVKEAINKIEIASKDSIENIENKTTESVIRKVEAMKLYSAQNAKEVVSGIEKYLAAFTEESKEVLSVDTAKIIDKIVAELKDTTKESLLNDVNKIKENVSVIERVSRKGIDATVLLNQAMDTIKKQQEIGNNSLSGILDQIVNPTEK